jgi:acetyl-CoA carboxylase biotin carboxyl carrier protein
MFMMDLKKVKEVIDLMKEYDLVEIELVDGDAKIHVKRPGAQGGMMQAVPMLQQAPAAAPAVGTPAPEAAPSAPHAGLVEIKSPIVGTFYQAPSPDADPYVKIGSQVEPDTVVCIIEAMKVMNEIKAETAGTIVEVCCKDGQAVEYGQVLFRVRP